MSTWITGLGLFGTSAYALWVWYAEAGTVPIVAWGVGLGCGIFLGGVSGLRLARRIHLQNSKDDMSPTKKALETLLSLSPAQRRSVMCWFCDACGEHVGPGANHHCKMGSTIYPPFVEPDEPKVR